MATERHPNLDQVMTIKTPIEKIQTQEVLPITDLNPNGMRDQQSITSDWQSLQPLIHQVEVKEVKNVLKDNGMLTEVFRTDWPSSFAKVDQVFQVTLFPMAISAWHRHLQTTDRLFVSQGILKIVLYDARFDSPTMGMINQFQLGICRPALIAVPPGVWHGIQNIGSETACLLNLVDQAYCYENPDHWRLPSDTDQIPFRFT
jgi:dTDP-4-dehydrorhamnose 3,5-epimerase